MVINFSHQYPQDVDVILSSSAPIYWPFSYRQSDHIEDCRQTFGEEPQYFQQNHWDVASMIYEVKVPQVIVVGDKDPWTQIGVRPDHHYRNIEYIYVVDG